MYSNIYNDNLQCFVKPDKSVSVDLNFQFFHLEQIPPSTYNYSKAKTVLQLCTIIFLSVIML